ncbi:MAG: formate dehydrogenase accessory sulfurtransferase FdhD [Candidatus Tectimicrobiota bacterium]
MPLLPILPQTSVGPLPTATRASVLALRQESRAEHLDWVATEEPLEIRVQGPEQAMLQVAVTMRTPGHDQELAVGFLYTEGLIRGRHDVVALHTENAPGEPAACNIVTVQLTQPLAPEAVQRNFYATSSCGICGKASLEQIAVHCAPVAPGPLLPRSVLTCLPATLRQAQRLFEQTGGLHACGLFDVSGQLLLLREDVGRHNALDKLVGHMLLADQVPLRQHILLVSGRTSLEIMQKAAMAQVPIVCAISAPSSLAIAAAQRFGMTLIGFLRDSQCNVYTHPERLALDC